MRIALITDGIWPYVLGGMQKHSYYLCKYLAQRKVHVHLFHFNQSSYDISKLEFFTDEEKVYITSTIIAFPKSMPFPGHYIYNSYKHSKLIFESLKDKLSTYDFIYTKGFTGWYLIDRKNKHNLKCAPIGVKFHGYEMFQKPPDFKSKLQHVFLLRNPVKHISQKADIVFSYGGKITDIIKSIGVAPDKIIELPSGAESSNLAKEIKPVTGTLKVLFLGRYERRKGIEEINDAIASFISKEQKRKIEFHFIGPIPQEKQIQNKSIVYHGEIRDKLKLTKLIKTCDVLICPSWSEGMPNVILEAMALGLTVIATDVGAVNVLVNNKTGYLINNSNEIESAIKQICNSSNDEINAKKQNALNFIGSNFVWENLIDRFILLINTAINK